MAEKGLIKPMAVLENFIDTAAFIPTPSQEQKEKLKKKFGLLGPSIIYMGRLSYEKSIDQIIKAFAILLKTNPKTQLMIIGDGPEKNNLVSLTNKLKLSKNVIFTGFLQGPELIEALQANDIFATASLSESFSLTIVEAMSCGLPIVAVREKGPAEIVKDNANGFFVQPNDPQEMAKKITELLSSPEKLKQFSLASRTLALNYSKENIIARLENLYLSLLNKKI
jgi:glycosyltransferase involved in cell wall biosynthesis